MALFLRGRSVKSSDNSASKDCNSFPSSVTKSTLIFYIIYKFSLLCSRYGYNVKISKVTLDICISISTSCTGTGRCYTVCSCIYNWKFLIKLSVSHFRGGKMTTNIPIDCGKGSLLTCCFSKLI